MSVVIQRQAIPTWAGMGMIAMFGRDRYKLALVGCGAGRFGKPGDKPGPEDIRFTFPHAMHLLAYGFIVVYRDLMFKIGIRLDRPESVQFARFRVACFIHQRFQQVILKFVDLARAALQACVYIPEIPGNGRIDQAGWLHTTRCDCVPIRVNEGHIATLKYSRKSVIAKKSSGYFSNERIIISQRSSNGITSTSISPPMP